MSDAQWEDVQHLQRPLPHGPLPAATTNARHKSALAAVFLFLIIAERRSKHTSEAWYWIAVIVLRTAATNIADLATHTFNLPCPWVIAALEFLHVLAIFRSFQLYPAPDGDCDGVPRPSANGWYWASLLTAGVLGTAIGDGVAEDLHLGTGLGTLALSIIMLASISLGVRTGWATKGVYWLAIIGVRAAGTTAGDWLAFGEGRAFANGLDLGLPIATTATGVAFSLTLCLWRPLKP